MKSEARPGRKKCHANSASCKRGEVWSHEEEVWSHEEEVWSQGRGGEGWEGVVTGKRGEEGEGMGNYLSSLTVASELGACTSESLTPPAICMEGGEVTW